MTLSDQGPTTVPHHVEIHGIPQQVSTCDVTLDALLGRWTARTQWLGEIAIPDGQTSITIGGILVGTTWTPERRSYSLSSRRTTVTWTGSLDPESLEPRVVDRQALIGQIGVVLADSPWHRLMANVARVADTDTDDLDSPQGALTDLILADIPSHAASASDYAAALADYQLGLIDRFDRATVVSLLSEFAGTRGSSMAELDWVVESSFGDPLNRAIECLYQDRTGDVRSYRDGNDLPLLRVQEPAASRAEAYLEIVLQRLRLYTQSARAAQTTVLDLGASVGQLVNRDGRSWLVVRMQHNIPASGMPRTTLTLRLVPPEPPTMPDDLQELPQRDMMTPR